MLRLTVIAFVVMSGAAGCAFGQQSPLGDGTGLQKKDKGLQKSNTGLQRDLQVPGTGTPAAGTYRDLAAEQRFRNSIITGNAAGGASFRGNVGYKDPKDFGGKLGSDDLFAFRRDSLYSGTAGMGIRGTDAIQYQFALSTGNVTGSASSLAGSLSVGRGASNNDATLSRAKEVARPETGLVTGMLRSSSTFESNRSLRPAYMGTRQPSVGKYERLFASGVGGLQYQPWERPAAGGPGNAPVPNAPVTSFNNAVDLSLNPLEQSRLKLAKSLEKPSTKPGEDPKSSSLTPDALKEIDKRLEDLRSGLRTAKPDATKQPDSTPQGNAPLHPLNPLEKETIDAIKNAGAKVDSFLPPAPAGPSVAVPQTDRYNQYMKDGETALVGKRFFDAEERFALALNARPGDLAAMVARLHSQIGAGMRVSAALNLRRIVTAHPETLGNTYDLSILGGADRLNTVSVGLRNAIAEKSSVADSALLLAYIGRQRGDAGKADLTLGITTLDAAQKAMAPSPDADAEAHLVTLLRDIWKVP